MGLRGSLACLALLLFSLVAAFPQPQEEDNDLEMEGEEDINEEEDEEEDEGDEIEDDSDIWDTSSVGDFVTLYNTEEVNAFDSASIPCCRGPDIESCIQVSVDQSQLGHDGVIELVENLKLKFMKNMERYSGAYLYMGRAKNKASIICNRHGCQGQVEGEKGEMFALEYCGPKYGHVWKKYSDVEIDYSELDYYIDENLVPVEYVEDVDETTPYSFSIKVYYTTDFRRSTLDIDCVIQKFIMDANQAYVQSQVPLHAFALCREEATEIEDVEDVNKMLEQFKNYKKSITDLRDGADVAILLVMNVANRTGKAFSLDGYKTGNSIAVVRKSAAWRRNTFAHEIGHIFGLSHDKDSAGKNPPFDFGFGYHIPGPVEGTHKEGYSTIMAYEKGIDWPRTKYFSNPNVIHPELGKPTGTETANNARVMLITRQRVSELGNESSSTCKRNPDQFENNFLIRCDDVLEVEDYLYQDPL